MAFDYSDLLKDKSYVNTWRDIYDDNLTLPENLHNFLRRFILLPFPFYDIAAAYLLIPSALAKRVPYIFCYGQTGSGKTTFAKIASYLWGVGRYGSNDTFVGIRNSLRERKYALIEIPSTNSAFPSLHKEVEANTGCVIDDVNTKYFLDNPNVYNMLKLGYDRQTDTIIISSGEIGRNEKFRCFCLKVITSISPLHLNELFKELQRRIIVLFFQRVEDISDKRLAELGTSRYTFHQDLLDVDAYNWDGFSELFTNFWTRELAQTYMLVRNTLTGNLIGLSSVQKAISLDLLTTGIVTGIWTDEVEGINSLKNYFEWLRNETEQYGGLSKYLQDYIAREKVNGVPLKISSKAVMRQINMWLEQGWILEKPRPKELKALLANLGLALDRGYWVKRN